jgi:hypothetical protein
MSPCPGESQCVGSCGDPGCCSCDVCQFNFLCLPKDGGTDGGPDGGDPCADPKNCKQPQCVGDPRCHVLGTEICNNGIDDNDDGLIDCMDPQCANFPGCKPHTCDAANPDCTDPACADNPKCKDLKCKPTVDFGTLMPMNSSSTKMENTTGTTDVTVTPCAPGGAGMVVGKFTLAGGKADVNLAFTQGAKEDHVFGLFRAGINQTCGANPVSCYDPKSASMGNHTFPQLDPGEYYVISQPFEPAGQGPLTVTLSTPSVKEICNNGIDDNGNGLIDCADGDCLTDPNCINQQCMPDFNVGALVVNAPGKSVSFNTTQANADNTNVSCVAQKGGKDVVVRFTLKETAGILLNWDQSGDHVVELYRTPGPGQKCDSDPASGCYDPSGRNQDTVAWGEFPPGDYEFIFKALKPGDEGHIDATISAYRNRRQELCHNGIDDDGNGLIDCADPACVGVAGCSAPYCMPDKQLGNLNVGQQASVTLNVQANGIAGYKASCAKGGAKGMVVQFTVPKVGSQGGIGVGFDCQQSGDHVLDLFAAGAPRDPCDAQELVCADPKTLPFGCGYEVPNLQPGTYNVIVEGFTPGSEGTVNLTLSVTDDRQLEICNNGKDDDGDGKIDCADRKCVTSQFCSAAQCRPDQTIDPLPLTGANTFRLVQTAMNGIHGQVPCATTAGGQGAVIGITLTATADLTLAWNQIGNHDFQLFTNDGTGLPCDAGTATSTCTQSAGAASGQTSWSKVAQGKYYLVIQGDAPDGTTQASGSVNIALSGKPSP